MIEQHVTRNAGHPWSGKPGWDLLEVRADNSSEITAFVAAAKHKFWEPWIIGVDGKSGKPCGVLYKPCGASRPWDDVPPN